MLYIVEMMTKEAVLAEMGGSHEYFGIRREEIEAESKEEAKLYAKEGFPGMVVISVEEKKTD